MKTKRVAKFLLVGSLIVAVAYWLRENDILTGLALLLLFVLVIGKVAFAFLSRRGWSPPSSGSSEPPDSPSRVTAPPGSPGGPPAVYSERSV